MILGLSVSTFTTIHVLISLVAIATGLVAVVGMLRGSRSAGWTEVFLVTTVLTSVTGFFFHSVAIGPPHILGVISLVVLAAVLPALYVFHLAGAWRWIYVAGAVLVLYLNVFVGVVQSFQKLTFLQPLAPTGSEPPFVIAQGVVLVLFIVLGIFAVMRFRPAAHA